MTCEDFDDVLCNPDSPTSVQSQFTSFPFEKSIPSDDSDALIANALRSLSLEERDKLYNDIHGVADTIDETPELVAQSLLELQEELVELRSHISSEAFDLAQSKDPDFVHNRQFQLRFLRADCFDSKMAAARMIQYFEVKQRLFGENKLCKEITYDDLNDDDRQALRKGYIQVLPERDRAGRAILVAFPARHVWKDPEIFVSLKCGEMVLYRYITFSILTECCYNTGPCKVLSHGRQGRRNSKEGVGHSCISFRRVFSLITESKDSQNGSPCTSIITSKNSGGSSMFQ
jgi:hypothetical protein